MSETTTSDLETAGDGRENRVKIGHLVVGLVFLGIAGSWALRSGGAIGDTAIGVLVPVVLVLAGVVGLLATVVGSRRRRRTPLPMSQSMSQSLSRSQPETRPETEPEPETDTATTYVETDLPDLHTEETAPIGSLPVDEPKEQQ
jgi:hypothetical protein